METSFEYLKRTFTLVLWFIGAQGAWFFYDLFFHADLSYPFWNEQYNWWPIVYGAVVGTMMGAALWMAAERTLPSLLARYRQPRVLRPLVAAQLANLRVASGTALSRLASSAPKGQRTQLVQ